MRRDGDGIYANSALIIKGLESTSLTGMAAIRRVKYVGCIIYVLRHVSAECSILLLVSTLSYTQ
jgi:hypothetical protein